MNLFVHLLFLFGWLSWFVVSTDSTNNTFDSGATFYCGQTPCKAPAHCCRDDNTGCCSSSHSSTSSRPSYWYIRTESSKYRSEFHSSGSDLIVYVHCSGEGAAQVDEDIYLLVGLVLVGGTVIVGLYFWRKRGGSLPYFGKMDRGDGGTANMGALDGDRGVWTQRERGGDRGDGVVIHYCS